ncbi:hypothetical protein AU387_13735 [Bacillus halotolerans]|nr:hypothetical protein AU387_13735 [Bacillus halotolerans]
MNKVSYTKPTEQEQNAKPNHLIQLVHRALSRHRKAQNQIILPNCQQIEKHYDYQMIEDYAITIKFGTDR